MHHRTSFALIRCALQPRRLPMIHLLGWCALISMPILLQSGTHINHSYVFIAWNYFSTCRFLLGLDYDYSFIACYVVVVVYVGEGKFNDARGRSVSRLRLRCAIILRFEFTVSNFNSLARVINCYGFTCTRIIKQGR